MMNLKTKTAEWGARAAVRFPKTFWFLFRAQEWVRRTWHEATPGERAWRGAALGLLVGTLLVLIDSVLHRALLPYPTYDRLAGSLRFVREAVISGIGLVIFATVVAKTPWRYRLMLGACAAVLASSFPFSSDDTALWVGVIAFSGFGAGLATISREDVSEITPLQRRIAIFGIVFGLATTGYLAYWLANPGMEPLEYRNAAVEAQAEGGASIAELSLPDPSTPGPHDVRYLTYGSGDDVRRPEFGQDADLVTPTVDGRPFLSSFNDERKGFWGFDRDELPLQGRVWYPDGDGPFPLVLVVHGNHSMYEYSDPGYRYLGELLASRGMILVSVDENFINGGIGGENDARGWLLLEHLAVWKRWNDAEPVFEVDDDEAADAEESADAAEDAGAEDAADPDPRADPAANPFVGKVDMSRIGLIGHSRGGEAVAVAAAFNTLPYYPDDATVPFDYGFDIGAVIAIAPVNGQYRPGGRYTQLLDVNYFVFHGANDGDVSSFAGASQYANVSFSGGPYRFKSSLYVMGANHGQWNEVWGDHDSGPPFGRSLSTRSLIAEEDQRKVAEVYIPAFLEATLNGELGYLPLFADARSGADWLPDTAYLLEFDDARSMAVANFDEDVDVTTATIAGGTTIGENLNVWREQWVSMKFGTKQTAGVYLGWEVDEEEEPGGAEEPTIDEVGADAALAIGDEPRADAGEDAAAIGAENSVESGAEIGAGQEPAIVDPEGVGGEEQPEDPTPRYRIDLPEWFTVDPDSVLYFSLADADESSSVPAHLRPDQDQNQQDEHSVQDDQDAGQGQQQGHGQQQGEHEQPQDAEQQQQQGDAEDDNEGEGDDEEDDEDEPREPIDLTIRLTDANGNAAEVPLSRFSLVQPQLEVQLRKAFLDDPRTESEAVFQSFLMPLEWFVEANPAFDAGRPVRIELVFDRSASGVVILDSVGFRGSPGL